MKRRYSQPTEILSEIDFERERAKRFIHDADRLDAAADQLFQIPERVEEAKEMRIQAGKKRTRANNIMEIKLGELGEKLSELLTPVLPALDNGDRSIPA